MQQQGNTRAVLHSAVYIGMQRCASYAVTVGRFKGSSIESGSTVASTWIMPVSSSKLLVLPQRKRLPVGPCELGGADAGDEERAHRPRNLSRHVNRSPA